MYVLHPVHRHLESGLEENELWSERLRPRLMLLLGRKLGVAAAKEKVEIFWCCNDRQWCAVPQAWLHKYGAGTSELWLYTVVLLDVNGCKLYQAMQCKS